MSQKKVCHSHIEPEITLDVLYLTRPKHAANVTQKRKQNFLLYDEYSPMYLT